MLDHIWGVITKKGYFVDSEWVRKILEIFNLTTVVAT